MDIHEESKNIGTVVCIASGEGLLRIYPLVKEYKDAGNRILLILGGNLKELEAAEDKMQHLADELFMAPGDESFGPGPGVVTILKQLFEVIEKSTHTHYPELVHAVVTEEEGRAISGSLEGLNIKSVIERF